MIHLLYSCDAWHTHTSKELIAVCDSEEMLIQIAESHANDSDTEEEGEQDLSEHDLSMLKTIHQTQSRSMNYIQEIVDLNERL